MSLRHGHAGRLKKSRTWCSWRGMVSRCCRPSDRAYANYGGRGIVVCDRWRRFENFLSDMGLLPVGMTLERIDNDGPYSPENCRWATRAEQNRNRTICKIIEYNGKRQCIAEWERELGFGKDCISYRLRNGWSIERAMTERPNP